MASALRHYTNQLIACVLLSAAVCATANAQSKSKAIPCPPIIGDKSAGIYSATAGRKSGSQFQCFRSAKDARATGYIETRSLGKIDFTGWYRISFRKLTKNTCGFSKGAASSTLFLQVRESDSALFGEFCPSIGFFAGSQTADGVVLAHSATESKIANLGLCTTEPVEHQEILELKRMINDDPLFSATFRSTYRCVSPGEGSKSCIIELSGIAFPETHKLWPPVSANITELHGGCSVALTRCADCHPGLRLTNP
jgi:hypothetical protein